MGLKEILCMKGGEGEASYFKSTFFMGKVNSVTSPMIEKAIRDLCRDKNFSDEVFTVADLGSASSNGVPGSFYGRLFPKGNLLFVRASYCVHWLSRVLPGLRTEDGLPLNKGKIYISKTSPPGVWEAYLKQFRRDFSLFLKHRSVEMIPDGRMVIVFQGRPTIDPTSEEATHPWEMMAEALTRIIHEGTIEKEKLDSFDLPYYIPYSEEIIEEIKKEGSFRVERVEIFSLVHRYEEEKDIVAVAKKTANNVRSFTEPVIASHFGDKILDELYEKFAQIVEESPSEPNMVTSIFVALKKKNKWMNHI